MAADSMRETDVLELWNGEWWRWRMIDGRPVSFIKEPQKLDLQNNPLIVDEDICLFKSPSCIECGKYATFSSPKNYCDENWCRWWGDLDAGRMYREAKLDLHIKNWPRPFRWLAQQLLSLMEFFRRKR